MQIILGTVQMGIVYGVNNRTGHIPKEKSFEILFEAFQNKIRTLDTAEAYGNAHLIIGDFHRSNPDKKFNIITKLPKTINPDNIESTIDRYLNELNIDSISVLMFHDFDTYSEIKNLINLQAFKKSKKVIEIGVSVYTNHQISLLLEDSDIDIIQHPYNLLDNYNQRGEIMEKVRLANKKIHTRSVFLQGLFFLDENNSHPAYNSLKKYILILKSIAEEAGISLQKLALGYCYQNEHSDGILIGVDSINHLRQDIECLKFPISKEVIKKINLINVPNNDLLNPIKWG